MTTTMIGFGAAKLAAIAIRSRAFAGRLRRRGMRVPAHALERLATGGTTTARDLARIDAAARLVVRREE